MKKRNRISIIYIYTYTYIYLKVYAGYVIEDGEINREATAKSDGVKYTKKVDIWALGIILYQIVFGSQPYSNVPGWHSQILSDRYKSMHVLGGKVSKMKAIANPNLPVEFPPVDNLDEDLLVNIILNIPEKKLSILI